MSLLSTFLTIPNKTYSSNDFLSPLLLYFLYGINSNCIFPHWLVDMVFAWLLLLECIFYGSWLGSCLVKGVFPTLGLELINNLNILVNNPFYKHYSKGRRKEQRLLMLDCILMQMTPFHHPYPPQLHQICIQRLETWVLICIRGGAYLQ